MTFSFQGRWLCLPWSEYHHRNIVARSSFAGKKFVVPLKIPMYMLNEWLLTLNCVISLNTICYLPKNDKSILGTFKSNLCKGQLWGKTNDVKMQKRLSSCQAVMPSCHVKFKNSWFIRTFDKYFFDLFDFSSKFKLSWLSAMTTCLILKKTGVVLTFQWSHDHATVTLMV